MTRPSAGTELGEHQHTGLQPERLLSHARQLAARAADTTAPRSVHARRAISASYYALFHRLCISVAWTVVPGDSDHVRWSFCRTFDHGPIESVAKWVQGQHKPPANALDAVQESRMGIDAVNAVYGDPAWVAFTSLVLLKSNAADR